MATKEKGHPAEGGPIQNYVLTDNSDFSLSAFQNQLRTSRLVRIYAIHSSLAETLAPLVFLEALR